MLCITDEPVCTVWPILCVETNAIVTEMAVPSTANPNIGDVRLLGDPRDGVGAVEYYDAQQGWTGICADPAHSSSWNSNTAAARIVCRQLGYEGGRPYSQRYRATFIEFATVISYIPHSSPLSLSLSLSLSSISTISTRIVADLECDPDSDFELTFCEKALTFCDANAEVGWVECDKTGEQMYI